MAAILPKKVSVVVPVLNDRDSVELFVPTVSNYLNQTNLEWEVIFVLDPSSDGTLDLLEQVISRDSRFKLLETSRKFGQSAATLAGLARVSGGCAIVMDVDLQDPPSLIPEMVRLWLEGAKLVLPRRRSRSGEPLTKVLTAKLGYKFLSKFSDVAIPANVGDFRLMDREVVELVGQFGENTKFLRGIVALVGFEPIFLDFDRPPRKHGETKYNQWFGSFSGGMNGVLGFSTAFLKISTYAGAIVSLASFLTGLSYIAAKLIGIPFPVGNPTIVVLVLFLGGINLLSMGIVGSYVGRIYDEVKRRPRYIIKNERGFH